MSAASSLSSLIVAFLLRTHSTDRALRQRADRLGDACVRLLAGVLGIGAQQSRGIVATACRYALPLAAGLPASRQDPRRASWTTVAVAGIMDTRKSEGTYERATTGAPARL